MKAGTELAWIDDRRTESSRDKKRESVLHTPNPGQSDPDYDPNDDAPDPPVPPDQEPDVVPVKEPPGPARGDEPMIVG